MTTASLWQGSVIVPLSSNRHFSTAVRFVLAGTAAVGLCLLLVPRFGPGGAALAMWLAAIAFRVVSVPNSVCRLLGQRPADFWYDAVFRGVPCLLAALLAAWVTSELTERSALHLFLVPLVTVTVVFGGSFFGWLSARERLQVRRVIGLIRP